MYTFCTGNDRKRSKSAEWLTVTADLAALILCWEFRKRFFIIGATLYVELPLQGRLNSGFAFLLSFGGALSWDDRFTPESFHEVLLNYEESFDYILIDEVHHAAADSYKRIIDYFTPDFMLGMTATPERTDGANICDVLPPPDRFAV